MTVILRRHLLTVVFCFVFCFCDAGECLWLHDLRLQELLWPLLWQKLPPCGLLCQPRPAHGDEPVAAAAPVGPYSTVPAAGRTVTMTRRLNVERETQRRVNGLSQNVCSRLWTQTNQRKDLFCDKGVRNIFNCCHEDCNQDLHFNFDNIQRFHAPKCLVSLFISGLIRGYGNGSRVNHMALANSICTIIDYICASSLKCRLHLPFSFLIVTDPQLLYKTYTTYTKDKRLPPPV